MELFALLGFLAVIAGEILRFRDAQIAAIFVIGGVILLALAYADLEVKDS